MSGGLPVAGRHGVEQFINAYLPRQFNKALTAGRGAFCDDITIDRHSRLLERAADTVALTNQLVSIDQTTGHRIHEARDSEGAANVLAIVSLLRLASRELVSCAGL